MIYERRKPNGYWDDFKNIQQELEQFIAKYGTPGVMPTVTQLRTRGYYGLASAISKNGGFSRMAEKLGLGLHRKAQGYWDDFDNMKRELEQFIAEHGNLGHMPGNIEFHHYGRNDLYNAIQRHGGIAVVARKLGLNGLRKSRSYWADFANIMQELEQFISEHGIPGYMPNLMELQAQGAIELCNAIQRAGGFLAVANKLHLRYQPTIGSYSRKFTSMRLNV